MFKDNMKILLFDSWIHEKNKIGLKLMCDSMDIKIIVSNKFEDFIDPSDIVFVPSDSIDPNYLPNAKNIVYGPHCFLFPTPPWLKNTHTFPDKCKYILPSKWTEDFVEETGGVSLPIIINPFAVDVEKFKPTISNKYLDCLVYFKHRRQEDIEYVENILQAKNVTYRKFIYGKYKEEDYIKTLNECKYAVWVTSTESQGFALQECLSMNVPIVVWNATSLFDEYTLEGKHVYKDRIGQYELKGTTIPYWDERCGISFIKKEDFETSLEVMRGSYTKFHPRDFVLENLSPKVCMERLLKNLKI
jgi:hypothetical protein